MSALSPKVGTRCACGAEYGAHRTGLTFACVRRMMFRLADDRAAWRQKRRSGVLGFWRELKVMDWHAVHGGCA